MDYYVALKKFTDTIILKDYCVCNFFQYSSNYIIATFISYIKLSNYKLLLG